MARTRGGLLLVALVLGLAALGGDAARARLPWRRSARDEAIHAAEERLLSRMPDTPYRVEDVEVQLPGGTSTIRTVVVGEAHRGQTPIVLVHGFMMGAAAFFKWLPLLARERTVYAVDIIGMGGSGRPPFDAGRADAEEAERRLVEPFERWVHALGLEEFHLVGHSFGGFVCAAWAARAPTERMRSLGLLSPLLGFSDARHAAFREFLDSSWGTRIFRQFLEVAWRRRFTPHMLVRWLPGARGFFERRSIRRFQTMASGVSEEEGRLLSEYVVATMDTPASLEASVTICFEPFLRPVAPAGGGTIKQRVAALRLPVFLVYGDQDWMDRARPEEVPNSWIHILPSSGHHLYLDNPEGLAKMVLDQMVSAEV